jgi:hypothetical protein
MRLPVKALVYPENCAHTEMVPAKIAAVQVGRMPVAIVERQSVQPGPYPLWGGFDVHGVMEPNHRTSTSQRCSRPQALTASGTDVTVEWFAAAAEILATLIDCRAPPES